ncbi:MAG TPA: pitrilysin family protein, partial [Candidatus Obscuribacterales bacterium]
MTRKLKLSAATAICAMLATATLPSLAQDLPKPLLPITQDFKLPNGLRVVLSEDHSAPVASVVLVYDVGSRDEVKGRSGFAHLFEHMMFEGSKNVGKTEHFKYVQGAGGACNASTHNDFTNYYDRIPSNQVNLALWLESDRMRSLNVTPENFKNQLETVKEEKRLRIDNQPYQPASVKLDEMVFDNWQNAHPVIGSFEDLEASSIDDVRKFFKTYYAPNNAVLAVAGDIDAADVHKQIEKYFSDIASQPQPNRPSLTEPAQTKEKYAKIEDTHAKMPAFWMSWKAPQARTADAYPLEIIEKLLSAGDSSRYYQRMVKGDEVALRADASYDMRRGPGEFSTFVIFKPNTTAEKAREIVWSELDKLKTQPVSTAELEKAKNQWMRDLFSSNSYSSLQKSTNRAEMLAQY